MVRRVLEAPPDAKAIWAAVDRGLRIDRIPANAALPDVSFKPTLGLTARRVDKFGADIRSFRAPLERIIKEVIIPSIAMNFDREGRPPWEPLSEATYELAARGVRRPIRSILVSSRKLKNASTAFARWDVGREAAIFRHLPNRVSYGVIHQAGYFGRGGGGRPVSSIPERPFIIIQDEDTDRAQEVFAEWLGERLDSNWPPGRVTF